MKNLSKVSKALKSSKALPNYVKVSGDTITISNTLDVLEIKNTFGLSDGIYRKEFLDKGIVEVSKESVSEVVKDANRYNTFVGTLTEANIKDMFDTIPFCSNDDLRPAFTGVYVNKDAIVATDAHKLRFLHKQVDLDSELIFGKDLIKLLNALGGSFEVYTDRTHNVRLVNDNVNLYSSVIDYKFANYKAVIPSASYYTATIAHKDLSNAISELKNYWNKYAKKVMFHFNGDGTLKLTAECIESQLHKEVVLNVKGDMPIYTIIFNGAFIQTALKVLDKKGDVTMSFLESNRACIVNNEVLLMPIM